jgi:hypothetical protein
MEIIKIIGSDVTSSGGADIHGQLGASSGGGRSGHHQGGAGHNKGTDQYVKP